MATSSRRIRFAPVKTAPAHFNVCADMSSSCTESAKASSPRKIQRSRNGCQQCKLRKLKCDETFPVCRRCEKRGSVCTSTPPPPCWSLELPWIFAHGESGLSASRLGVDSALLQWWFDRACHMLAMDPSVNPLSYPILEHMASSAALLHAVQSISAAHRHDFNRSSLVTCLQQRSAALELIQQELRTKKIPPLASYLTIFMLGISAPWIDDTYQDTGKEHLAGARAILDTIISDTKNWLDPSTHIIMGYYLFWDMAISSLAEPQDLPPLDTPEFLGVLSHMNSFHHPLAGFLVHLFYLHGCLNRYFKVIREGEARDLLFESDMEDRIWSWHRPDVPSHLEALAKAFQRTGIILINHCKITSPVADLEDVSLIRAQTLQYAKETVKDLLEAPVTESWFIYQAIPLAMAAAELPVGMAEDRKGAVSRLKAIFSACRVTTILSAASLLEELWEWRDRGVDVTYLELMRWKNWKLTLV